MVLALESLWIVANSGIHDRFFIETLEELPGADLRISRLDVFGETGATMGLVYGGDTPRRGFRLDFEADEGSL